VGNVGIAVSEPCRRALFPNGERGTGLLVALPRAPAPEIALYECAPASAGGGGQPAQTLRGHLEPASAVCFRPNGGGASGQLVSAGGDGLCLCWERDERAAAEHRARTRKRPQPGAAASGCALPAAVCNPATARSDVAGGFLPERLLAHAYDGDTWSSEEEEAPCQGAGLVARQGPRVHERSRVRRTHNAHA
jgi:hypothetical protein